MQRIAFVWETAQLQETAVEGAKKRRRVRQYGISRTAEDERVSKIASVKGTIRLNAQFCDDVEAQGCCRL